MASRYRQFQQTVHPDKFVTASEQERRLSVQHAARINDAYHTLKDPLKRAQYILELSLASNNMQESDSVMDSAFLMHQMELREELESIPASADAASALDAFLVKTLAEQKKIIAELDVLFKNINPESLAIVSETVKKLQFINKLREETISLEDEIY